MNDDLKVVVQAAVDIQKSKNNINNAIKEIEKQANKIQTEVIVDTKSAQQALKQQESAAKKRESVLNQQLVKEYYANIENEKKINANKLKQQQEYITKQKQIASQLNRNQSQYWDGRFKDSINNMTSTPDGVKQLNAYYKELEKTSFNANKINNANINLGFDKQKLGNNIQTWMNNNSRAAREFESQLKRIQSEITNADKTKLNKLNKEFQAVKSSANEAGLTAKTWSDQFKTHIQSFIGFLSVGTLVMQTVNSVRQMVTNVVALDESLVELQKVSDLTGNSLVTFTDNAYKAGKEIGRTGKEVIDATTIFKRAGYTLQESLDLSKASLVMTNVGDGIDNVKDASSALISVLKGFKMKDSEALSVVDRINQVSNTSAIDFVNITEGLRRVSGTLSQTGASIEQTIGLLTGGFGQLRDIEMVSSGLIMISQRLRGIDEDGKAIDGLAPKIAKDFKEIANIDIEDGNGELRNTFDILSDMARIFPNLTSKQKQYLGELAAGNRQVKVLNSILQGWGDVEKAVGSATNSYQSASIENEKYLSSIKGVQNQFESQMQILSKNAIDNNSIKSVIKFGTSILELIDDLGLLKNAVLLVSTALLIWQGSNITSFLKNFNILANLANMNLVRTGAYLKGVQMDALATKSTVDLLKYGFTGLGNAIKGAFLSNPLGVIAVILTTLVSTISLVNAKIEENKQKTEESRQKSLQNADAIKQEYDAILELKSKYKNINDTITDSTKRKSELVQLQKSLVTSYGNEASGIDLVNGKIDTQIKKLDSLAVAKAKASLAELGNEPDNARKILRTQGDLTSYGAFSITNTKGFDKFREEDIQSFNKYYQEYSKLAEGINGLNVSIKEDELGGGSSQKEYFKGITLEFKGSLQERIKAYEEFNARLELIPEKQAINLRRSLASLFKVPLDDYKKSQETIIKSAESELIVMESLATKLLDKAKNEGFTNESKKQLDELKSKMLETAEIAGRTDWISNINLLFGGAANSSDDLTNSLSPLKDTLKSISDQTGILSTAWKEMNDSGEISTDTILKLIESDSAWADSIEMVNGKITINKDLFVNSSKAIVQGKIAEVTAFQAAQKAIIDSVNITGKALIDNAKNIGLSAQMQLQGMAGTAPEKFAEASKQLEVLQGLLDRLNSSDPFEPIGTSAKKAKDEVDKLNKATQEQLKSEGDAYIKAIDSRIAKLNDEKDAVTKAHDDKIAQLQAEKDALNEQYEAEDQLLKLKKAKQAFLEASRQKTVRILKDGKFTYDVDQESIDKAKEDLDSAQKEYDKYKADKAIDEKIKAYENAKKIALESLDAEIEKWQDLKDNISEQMSHIGETFEEHQAELDLIAQAQAMTFDSMAKASEDYARRVISAMKAAQQATAGNTNVSVGSGSSSGSSGGSGSSTKPSLSNDKIKQIAELEARIATYQNNLNNAKNSGAGFSVTQGIQSQIDKLKAELKGIRGFRTGGIADFTGMAILHGTPQNPEMVINQTQAGQLFRFIDKVLPQINVQQKTLSGLNLTQNKTPISLAFQGDIIVQGVQDTSGLATKIVNNLPNAILQELYKR